MSHTQSTQVGLAKPQTTTPKPKPRAIVPKEDIDTTKFNLGNIQGDIFPTFSKKVENFIFFNIIDDNFTKKLAEIIPHITTSSTVIEKLKEVDNVRRQYGDRPKERRRQHYVKLEQVNIAFSPAGLTALSIDPSGVGDNLYTQGQLKDAVLGLGDHPDNSGAPIPDWEPEFKSTLHGVFIIASECKETLVQTQKAVLDILGATINVAYTLEGQVRPQEEEGHEHFGFLDGVSEPALEGLTEPHTGQLRCRPDVVIFGHPGDQALESGATIKRKDWTKDGSIMAFRKLKQKVPEFAKFVQDNAVPESTHPELTDQERADLTGARLVGRWKSGAPVDLAPVKDNLSLVDDVDRVNAFNYTVSAPQDVNGVPGQARCPFTAHIRKTAPREGTSLGLGPRANPNDPDGRRLSLERSMIVRAGIPYGPEVSDDERDNHSSSQDRGLAFVCYQTELARGFRFIQNTWSSNPGFPLQEKVELVSSAVPGEDPIIGNKLPDPNNLAGSTRTRIVTGVDIKDPNAPLTLESDFVVATGGEYFFVPSLDTLSKIADGTLASSPNDTEGVTVGAPSNSQATFVGGGVGGGDAGGDAGGGVGE